jgi:hypothetical protein
MTYPLFREGLTRCNILLNRKTLADLAVWEPRTFKVYFCLHLLILIGLYLFHACVFLQAFGPTLHWQVLKVPKPSVIIRVMSNSIYRLPTLHDRCYY